MKIEMLPCGLAEHKIDLIFLYFILFQLKLISSNKHFYSFYFSYHNNPSDNQYIVHP